jgi:hypothetical protein
MLMVSAKLKNSYFMKKPPQLKKANSDVSEDSDALKSIPQLSRSNTMEV